jgi:vacuole morphology and inheritance protein 14
MLLPQSSAFAALRNRLNSVSSIGYLHTAPKAWVSSYALLVYREIAPKLTCATLLRNNTSTTGPNFDRPNRLKGREDGIIRWGELLEKFRSVQEHARRSQRTTSGYTGDLMEDSLHFGLGSEFRVSDSGGVLEHKNLRDAGSTARTVAGGPPVPAKDASVQPVPPTKAKSSLGKQLGRFGGAVSGRVKRGH